MHNNKKMIYLFFIIIILAFGYVWFAMPADSGEEITGKAWGRIPKFATDWWASWYRGAKAAAEEICKDTDGGKDYFVKGATSWNSSTITDSCINSMELDEGFCHEDGIGGSVIIKCQIGCKDGACVQTTTHGYPCTDADNTRDLHNEYAALKRQGIATPTDEQLQDSSFYTFGRVTCGTKSYSDYCRRSSLLEKYIHRRTMETARIICTGGCEKGACIRSPKLIKDGDAYFGQDENNPDWVWNIENGYVGVENDFIKDGYSDNVPSIGECYYLPNNYASICFDSLTVPDTNYLPVTIENSYEDMSDIGETVNEKVIVISATGDDRFMMIGGVESTSKIYVGMKDATTGFIAYDDPSSNPRTRLYNTFTGTTLGTEVALMNYGSSGNLRFLTNLDNGMVYIHLIDELSTEELVIEFNEDGERVTSLGKVDSQEETHELRYRGPAIFGEATLGTKDEDHRMAYGIIIKNPKLNGAGDMVSLQIPDALLKANIKVDFGGHLANNVVALNKKIYADSLANPRGEVLLFGPLGMDSPSIETSLTSSEDDYESYVYMEALKDSIKYRYDTQLTGTTLVTLLGQDMTITPISVDTIRVE